MYVHVFGTHGSQKKVLGPLEAGVTGGGKPPESVLGKKPSPREVYWAVLTPGQPLQPKGFYITDTMGNSQESFLVKSRGDAWN